ncbi:hypothetical protein NEOC65_002470, partial [Neochlamydia sp. AcF65]|nr:hypothetical protein [Neochlamydia sp. AcF65]
HTLVEVLCCPSRASSSNQISMFFLGNCLFKLVMTSGIFFKGFLVP